MALTEVSDISKLYQTKHLCGMGEDWPLYVAPSCFAMNCQVSLITKYSPYEMIYLIKTLSEIITKHLCGMGEDWPL